MTETILYYDCFAGISGDMNLGALIDLGVPLDYLTAELEKLGVEGWKLNVTADSKHGIRGTKVEVELVSGYVDDHHGHPHRDEAAEDHHDHRSYGDIRHLIQSSSLPDPVKKRAVEIFRRVAEAEATVHGQSIDEVHFHEVGAVDSIIDIVGAAICLEYLSPDKIFASTVELGGGFVKCQHGLLPVPAPATALILAGVPVKSGAVPFEMTTPTGAAILAASVEKFSDNKEFVIRKTGYGVGHRDTEIPNLLRVFLAEAETAKTETHCVLECNIDDMNPELYAHVSELLFAAGADDVWFTPIIMKKSRPAVTLSVLCGSVIAEKISFLMLRETTSFGLRKTAVEKTAMERSIETVATSLGEVRVKSACAEGVPVKSKPEYEDCLRIAKENNLPLRAVYDIILREIG